MIRFQALSSRRFQRGFGRVNLHQPTMAAAATAPTPAAAAAAAASPTALSQGRALVPMSAQHVCVFISIIVNASTRTQRNH